MSGLHLYNYKPMWDVGVFTSSVVLAARGWVGVLQILAYSEVSRGKMNAILLNRVRWDMGAENVHVRSTECPTAQSPTPLSMPALLLFF